MTPTHTRKRGRLYRYYLMSSAIRSGLASDSPIRRISAIDIEAVVVDQIRLMVRSPEIVATTWRFSKRHIKGLTEQQVREHLDSFIDLWSELFPAEQARIIQLLVARVEIGTAGADITLRTEGLTSLIRDIGFKENQDCAA
jgi:hypothetical protein